MAREMTPDALAALVDERLAGEQQRRALEFLNGLEPQADKTLVDQLADVVRELINEIIELREARNAYRSTERQTQMAQDQMFADLIKEARGVLNAESVPHLNPQSARKGLV